MAGKELQPGGWSREGCDSHWDLPPPREQEVAQMFHPVWAQFRSPLKILDYCNENVSADSHT